MDKTVKYIVVALITLLVSLNALAQKQKVEKEKFKVYGNCEMCEERIEGAAESLDGLLSADWDKLSEKIKVKYDPSKVKLLEIHEAIADVGHDTEKLEAEGIAYEELPGCCKYERKSQHDTKDDHDGYHH